MFSFAGDWTMLAMMMWTSDVRMFDQQQISVLIHQCHNLDHTSQIL